MEDVLGMRGYLLDTHVWIWLLSDADALKPRERKHLSEWQQEQYLFVSAISIWEIARKQADDELDLGVSLEAWMERSFRPGALQLVELSVPILIRANRLPGKVHGDPADRMLMGTAIEHDLTLVTHDGNMLRYSRTGALKVHAF